MAIARVGTVTEMVAGSNTVAHDAGSTGSDRYLVVHLYHATDIVTGVTYAGAAMTELKKLVYRASQCIYIYGLAAPATDSNNIVVSTSGAFAGYIGAANYTGVSATQPDATGSQIGTGSSNTTVSVTTIADNCAIVGTAADDNGTASAGTGMTILNSNFNATGLGQWESSSLALTPAGSQSCTLNDGSGALVPGLIAASLAPAVDAADPTGRLFFKYQSVKRSNFY